MFPGSGNASEIALTLRRFVNQLIGRDVSRIAKALGDGQAMLDGASGEGAANDSSGHNRTLVALGKAVEGANRCSEAAVLGKGRATERKGKGPSERTTGKGGKAVRAKGKSKSPPARGKGKGPVLHGKGKSPPMQGKGKGKSPPMRGKGKGPSMQGKGKSPPKRGQ